MVQTIVKCISASSNIVSADLSQEIFQINVQSRLLLDQKPTTGSQASAQQPGSNLSLQQQTTAAQNVATANVKSLLGVGAPSANSGGATGAGGNQQGAAAFDIIQSMINLNMNTMGGAGANANNFGNSPGKLILSQLSSAGQLNPLNLSTTLSSMLSN